jgi:fumarate reductase subunit D
MDVSTSMNAPKRANKPPFWALFGAGGMVSALIGPALVLTTGFLVPLGLGFSPQAMDFAQVQALMGSVLFKLALVGVIGLFLFHGMHRLYHTLHDFGLHITPAIKALCHGLAGLGTLVAIVLVF